MARSQAVFLQAPLVQVPELHLLPHDPQLLGSVKVLVALHGAVVELDEGVVLVADGGTVTVMVYFGQLCMGLEFKGVTYPRQKGGNSWQNTDTGASA